VTWHVSPTTTLHVDLIGNTRPRSAEWQLNFDISSRFRNAYRRMRFSAKAPQAPNAKSQPLSPPIEESRSPPAFNSTQQEWERTITEGPPQCFFRIEPSGSTPRERLLPPNIPEQKVQPIGHRSFFLQRVGRAFKISIRGQERLARVEKSKAYQQTSRR